MTRDESEALKQKLERFVNDNSTPLVQLTQELVAEASVQGAEGTAQQIVEEKLRQLGFNTERVQPDADALSRNPLAGHMTMPYEGRTCVVARLPGSNAGKSMHLSGHIDVVPVEADERWVTPPWEPVVVDNRLYGRGAGDMKAGLAAYLLAVEAVLAVVGTPQGDIIFSSVIEEECTGNGMIAVLEAGYQGDATLIGEPSGLRLMYGGVGVTWSHLTARGDGGHARLLEGSDTPIDKMTRALDALRALERRINAERPGLPGMPNHPYRLNVGMLEGGVWPSSQAAEVSARVRLGYGPDYEPQQLEETLRNAVKDAEPEVEVAFDGFRAHAYAQDLTDPFVDLVRECHTSVQGSPPDMFFSTGTTDARYVDGPVLCYGPLAGNTHGLNEWVDLETVKATAITVALAVALWCGEAS
jgi:acetylornithine deacetylase